MGAQAVLALGPPAKAAPALRPDGRFGVQITLTINGAPQTLWLGGSTLKDAIGNEIDVFRTPPAVPLGLPVGQMIDQLLKGAHLNAPLPDVVTSTKVNRLEIRQAKGQSKELSFGLEIELNHGKSGDSTLRLWLVLGKQGSQWTFEFKLYLGKPADPVEVQVTLDNEGNFLANFSQSAESLKGFNLGAVGRVLSPELESLMGAIEVTPLMMVIGSHKASGNYVLAFQLSGSIALSRLPFVGEQLPPGLDLGISNLGLVWCSAGLAGNQAAQATFKQGFAQIKLINPDDDAVQPLSLGGMFSANLTVPSQPEILLNLPLQSPGQKPTQPTKSAQPVEVPEGELPAGQGAGNAPENSQDVGNAIVASPDPVKWFKVGKEVGPLSLQRIGLKYADQKVWFLFDAAISANAVVLTIDGLGAGIDPFKLLGGHFQPAFTLRGLGLTIKGPVEVSGAFLRDRISDPRGDYDQFAGVVLIKTQALTVSGMGSYADPPWGDPSFFAYAFLDRPIGGPPFFFVTGMAVGIAINCSLDLPPIDQVSQFPLVRLARGTSLPAATPQLPAGGDDKLAQLLQVQQSMRPYTQPKSGQVALAIGVRFTTFKVLDSFGLLVATFGKPFKLDLLISSRLQIPAPTPNSSTPLPPPIAQVGIDLRGTWVPEEGTLLVEGRITKGSWFLDSNCRLSGGAAFASWTNGPHSGDFVLTVGGYHPQFEVPAHYPQVPRLAMNFNRDAIAIKAAAYFALTPAALMVGGSLSATYNQGNVGVWFNCEANFLMAWEPFHYQASLYVEIGASYRTFFGTVRAAIGAQLTLWGPDLAGVATVNVGVFKFDVAFGDQSAKNKTLRPATAQEFRNRFLPSENNDLINIGVVNGLIRSEQIDGAIVHVVNPAGFCLAIESVIPQADGTRLGIGSMGKTTLGSARVLCAIDKEASQFDVREIRKPVPAALWGPAAKENEVRSPSLNAKASVIEATVGYTIKPKQAWATPEGEIYSTKDLAATDSLWERDKPDWAGKTASFTASEGSVADILDKISTDPPLDLLIALTGEELDEPTAKSRVSLTPAWLVDLQTLPQVVTLEGAK